MADIFACRATKQASTARGVPGELEVDECRAAVVKNEQIGFLCEIVMAHARPVQASQETSCRLKPQQVFSLCLVQWFARKIAANQGVAFMLEELRHALHAIECSECLCLTSEQIAGEPAQ